MKEYNFNFLTSYHQFYLADGSISAINGLWNEDSQNRVTSAPGLIGVQIESYGKAEGKIVLLENENKAYVSKEWDHIVEVDMQLSSERLEVKDCPNFERILGISLLPANYRVRIYSRNLTGVTDPDDENNPDYYRIELWKSLTKRDIVVLKEFKR